MELKSIEYKLTVCKVADISEIDWMADFYFVGKTDEEISLVCKTEDTPDKTVSDMIISPQAASFVCP